MEHDVIQGWTIIKDDKTLIRALKRTSSPLLESYQRQQIETAMDLCENYRTGIDIGANYGLMCQHMSRRFQQVHAFEIEPKVYKCLEMNMAKFNLDNVKTYAHGIGEIEQNVSLNYNAKKSTFSTHVTPGSDGDIPVKPLDSLELTDVDFIKIDAEGYEPLIIKGGIKLITTHRPVILYECKGHEARYGHSKDTVLEILSPLGYQSIAYAGGKNKIIGVK